MPPTPHSLHRSANQFLGRRWVFPLLAIATYITVATTTHTRSLAKAFHDLSWVPAIAQALPPTLLTQQGNQIRLNGRLLNAPWSQRQQHIGIADFGLTQVLGATLNNTTNPAQQPVRWFPEEGNPLYLGIWLTEQYRYLDITALSERENWQVQVNGTVLEINTPPANLVNVRQGHQNWGDRLVLDLDRPTPWQLTNQNGDLIVTIDAAAAPSLPQTLVPLPDSNLTTLRLERDNALTRLALRLPPGVIPQIQTLSAPDRLVIDLLHSEQHSEASIDQTIRWAPGIQWQQRVVRLGTHQFPLVMLRVDPRQAGLQIQPIRANLTHARGTAPLITIARQAGAVAAINGGFFNRNNQLPLGVLRQNDRWISGPILNRGAIAWNESGEVKIAQFSLRETIKTANGQEFPVTLLNTGYVRAGIARYTRDWGSTYTNIIDNEVLISVEDQRVVRQQPSGPQGHTTLAIPPSGYLLVARSFNTAVNALPVGTTLQQEQIAIPADIYPYPNIVGAGPLLIQNRQIVLNAEAEGFSAAFVREQAVRSAIARMDDGTLLLVTIQNRLNGAGPTLAETAQIMQQLGSIDALNLDGGSSSTLYLGNRLLNRSPDSAARVHNGIGIFIRPPS